jgi:hypothetical protein
VVWRLAERECIELTAGREAKGYWRLSPERRAAVIEARRDNPNGKQQEIARAAGVIRATVGRIERGDRRGTTGPSRWDGLRKSPHTFCRRRHTSA